MFHFVAQASALAGSIFQSDSHRRLLGSSEHFVQAGHDLVERRFLSRPQMGSRMHHQKRKPKRGRQLNLLEERFDREVPILRCWRSQVDQIARMAEYTTESI